MNDPLTTLLTMCVLLLYSCIVCIVIYRIEKRLEQRYLNLIVLLVSGGYVLLAFVVLPVFIYLYDYIYAGIDWFIHWYIPALFCGGVKYLKCLHI